MHSLETIRKINEAAVRKAIDLARAEGKHVVVRYAGLNVERYWLADSSGEAGVFASAVPRPGSRVEVLPPLDSSHAAALRGRDQSEDRS